MKRRQRNMAPVDLEEATQCGTRVAASETVSSQRDEARLDVTGDTLRIGADVVARGDDRRMPGEQPRDVA